MGTVKTMVIHQGSVNLHEKTSELFKTPDEAHERFLQKRTEELTMRFRADLFEIERTHDTFVTLKPFTSYQLLELSYTTPESVKSDDGKKITDTILTLQYTITKESHFDIGVEWIRLKNKLGLKF